MLSSFLLRSGFVCSRPRKETEYTRSGNHNQCRRYAQRSYDTNLYGYSYSNNGQFRCSRLSRSQELQSEPCDSERDIVCDVVSDGWFVRFPGARRQFHSFVSPCHYAACGNLFRSQSWDYQYCYLQHKYPITNNVPYPHNFTRNIVVVSHRNSWFCFAHEFISQFTNEFDNTDIDGIGGSR